MCATKKPSVLIPGRSPRSAGRAPRTRRFRERLRGCRQALAVNRTAARRVGRIKMSRGRHGDFVKIAGVASRPPWCAGASPRDSASRCSAWSDPGDHDQRRDDPARPAAEAGGIASPAARASSCSRRACASTARPRRGAGASCTTATSSRRAARAVRVVAARRDGPSGMLRLVRGLLLGAAAAAVARGRGRPVDRVGGGGSADGTGAAAIATPTPASAPRGIAGRIRTGICGSPSRLRRPTEIGDRHDGRRGERARLATDRPVGAGDDHHGRSAGRCGSPRIGRSASVADRHGIATASPTLQGGDIHAPRGVAVDSLGNVWATVLTSVDPQIRGACRRPTPGPGTTLRRLPETRLPRIDRHRASTARRCGSPSQADQAVASITQTGAVTQYPLSDLGLSNTFTLGNLLLGPDGNLWVGIVPTADHHRKRRARPWAGVREHGNHRQRRLPRADRPVPGRSRGRHDRLPAAGDVEREPSRARLRA